jgi:hypothetical protein
MNETGVVFGVVGTEIGLGLVLPSPSGSHARQPHPQAQIRRRHTEKSLTYNRDQ